MTAVPSVVRFFSMRVEYWESQCMSLLEKRAYTTSILATKMKIPRTTMAYRLEKLRRQGMVKIVQEGPRGQLLWAYAYSNTHSKRQVITYSGSTFWHAFKHVLRVPKGSVI